MRFKNITLLLGALLMLSATSQAANVALGKKVYASSNQQPPELAVDDNLGTRWESKASDGDNQWFYVDLEKGTIIKSQLANFGDTVLPFSIFTNRA